MRFDDCLRTVLSADTSAGLGAQSAWRQLLDLVGRRRIAADDVAIRSLKALRLLVPLDVRVASARALALLTPPSALVFLLAEDELSVAAPVIRTVNLSADTWLALLPRLTPAMRSILRQRIDLPPDAARGLQAFGSTDFVLSDGYSTISQTSDIGYEPVEPAIQAKESLPTSERNDDKQRGIELLDAPISGGSGLDEDSLTTSDIVLRIEAFRQTHTKVVRPALLSQPSDRLCYEADVKRLIRWAKGAERSALVSRRFDRANVTPSDRRDAGRAVLEVGGTSDAAGTWLVASKPVYDRRTGRLVGARGVGRRWDDAAASARQKRSDGTVSDGLRQIAHELRTPTNAIAGFAELIETQLLGPVAPAYRDRAAAIRGDATDLIEAIDDLDMAAQIDGNALRLDQDVVPLEPLLIQIVSDLSPLASLRGVELRLASRFADVTIVGDQRALERLLGRLLAALVAAGRRDERIRITVEMTVMPETVAIRFDRPADLQTQGAEEVPTRPLLGTVFSLRLAQSLAMELGGRLIIEEDRLTLWLAVPRVSMMDRATTSQA